MTPGTKLGPYEILALIGEGGMGEVYRARDPRLGREVALKIVLDCLANNPGWRARFETEARAVSALNHPGIVTIHDIGNSDGVAYLVTEFIDGSSLRQSRPETLRRQLDAATQIAEALAAAHAAGITHRDLNPENIMICRSTRPGQGEKRGSEMDQGQNAIAHGQCYQGVSLRIHAEFGIRHTQEVSSAVFTKAENKARSERSDCGFDPGGH